MAIKHVESGKYLKVVRDLTEFRPNSVIVHYYEFSSKEARDTYFSRQNAVKSFLALGSQKYNDLDMEAVNLFISLGGDFESVKSEKDLPPEVLALVLKGETLVFDLNELSRHWDKPTISKVVFKDLNYLKEIGLKSEWLTPLEPVELNALNTGAYTNQTFEYGSLYKELKKVLGTDFIDC